MRMKNITMTEGPVNKIIVSLTLPMIVGMLGFVVFNLVDTFYISRLGTVALAAMSFTFPVVMFQAAISVGLGVGASSVISRAIGSGDTDQVRRLTADGIMLAGLFSIVLCTAGLVSIRQVFSALGAGGETLEMVRQYMSVWYLGVPFVIVTMVINNAIRAAGNTKIPSGVMIVSIMVNIILDPLLIFGIGPFPRMGIEGAAIATVFARSISLAVSFFFLQRRLHMFTGRFDGIRQTLDSWRRILYIGVPAAVTQMLTPLGMGFITKLVSLYGEKAVAGLGVGSRIEMFALAPVAALGMVLTPFTGQNLGAGRMLRVRSGVRFSAHASLLFGGIIFFAFLFLRAPIAGIFTAEPETIEVIGWYMMLVSVGYGLQGLTSNIAAVFNGLNSPLNATGVNLMKMVVLLIPLCWLGSSVWGLKGIFIGMALSSIGAGALSYFWLGRALTRYLDR